MAVVMTDNKNEMYQKKGDLVASIRKVNDDKELSQVDKTSRLEAMFEDLQSIDAHIKAIEKNESLMSTLPDDERLGGDGEYAGAGNTKNIQDQLKKRRQDQQQFIEYRNSSIHFDGSFDTDKIPVDASGSDEYNDVFNSYLLDPESNRQKMYKASRDATVATNMLSADGDSGEDKILAPMQLHNQFLRDCDKNTFIRRLARVFRARNLAALGVLKRTKKMSSFAMGCICETPVCDTPSIGMKSLQPHPAAACTSVCRDLLRRTAFNVQGFLSQELAINVAEEQEKLFFLGNGQNQPLGLMVESAAGISSDRDIDTINSLAIISDDLFEMWFNTDECVRSSQDLAWIFPTNTIKAIALMKDGEGQYLWRPGLQAGIPDTLLGKRVWETSCFSTTLAAGEYAGILGNFNDYWIFDGPQLRLEQDVLPATDTINFYLRLYFDGAPIREQSFTRLKVKA